MQSEPYRGVSYDKARDKWRARAEINGRQHWLGRHSTKEDAARAVRECRDRLGIITEPTPPPTPEGCLWVPLRRHNGSVRDYALIDAEMSELDAYRWVCVRGYAYRVVGGSRPRPVLMHRVVLGILDRPDLEGDHVNRNRLDNRRANLRVVTREENAQNVPGRGGRSIHRGVRWDARAGKWFAVVGVNGRRHLGPRVETEEEAARIALEMRASLMTHAGD